MQELLELLQESSLLFIKCFIGAGISELYLILIMFCLKIVDKSRFTKKYFVLTHQRFTLTYAFIWGRNYNIFHILFFYVLSGLIVEIYYNLTEEKPKA